jgi:ribonucleotide reductase beta subunit family protein with ferritin-like domain
MLSSILEKAKNIFDFLIGKSIISVVKNIDIKNYILFTDIDAHSWSFYKRQEASDWSAEEFEFVKEAQEYKESPPNIQNLIDRIITFFLFGDGLIAEGITKQLESAIRAKNWPRFFWLCMKLKIENTHAETYSKAAFTIIPKDKHEQLFYDAQNLRCMKLKSKWMKDAHLVGGYDGSDGLQNVTDAASEGIFFVSQFAIIFYLRKLGMFDNFIESNEQISKDETTHRDKAAEDAKELLIREDDPVPWYIPEFLHHYMGYRKNEIPQAIKILKEAVEIEKEFIDFLLQDPILGEQSDRDSGMTIENMHRYIEQLADEICMIIEIEPIYNNDVINLKWMEDINMSQKSNFYERMVNGSYRKFGGGEDGMTYNRPQDVSF